MSMRDFADAVGYDVGYISKVLSGRQDPSIRMLRAMAICLKLDDNEKLLLLGL